MIQRIQTLWLLLAALALLAVPFLPVGMFKMEHGLYECTAFNWTAVGDVPALNPPVWLIGSLSILSGLLSLVAVFLFRKRSLQIGVSWVAFAVCLLLLIGLATLFLYFKKQMDSWVGYGPGVLMPVLAIILNFMAIRSIRKDEELVRSLDRIR